jgi:hypothetical protein
MVFKGLGFSASWRHGLTVFAACAVVAACGAPNDAPEGVAGSSVKTVDLPHTPVKWQSIGNCWVYAALGWLESQVLASSGEALDLSETYITYRHFERQLLSDTPLDELQTGGFWRESVRLMLDYGVMKEGDFVPGEEGSTKSPTQALALDTLNRSLQKGALSRDRSPDVVRAELDAAFGVRLQDVADKIVSLDQLSLGRDAEGNPRTARSEITQWTESRWPLNWSSYPSTESQLPLDVRGKLSPQQSELLQRVKRALNDGHPVIMNWWVDFNALDATGAFDLETVRLAGPGRQGYHSTVIEDYVAFGVDPDTGTSFRIGEGEASPEDKLLAERFGNIEYFVIKNSWGGAERPDRSSYARFGEKGYAKLNANYLFGWMKLLDDSGEYSRPETGLNGFVLPVGY